MKIITGQWPTAANGTVRLELSKYALISGTTRNAPRFYQISLDANGFIPAGYEIWANDELMPEGTSYRRIVFSSAGLILFGPDQIWVCGTAPIDITTAPTSVPPITPPPNPITITPGFVTLQPGQSQQFTANMAVTWSSSDNAITSAGLYTAPNVTSNTMVTITATDVSDPTNKSQIVISIQPVVGITVSISPGSASLNPGQTQQFTATVAGSSNRNVTWALTGDLTGPNYGTINSSGLYTAPTTVPAAFVATVTATAVADPTISSSVNVSVQPTAVVSVTVAPSSATLTSSQTQQFSAIVSGSANQAVTWALTGDLTGPTYGTVSSTGLYTAPAGVTAATAFVATVTATSVANPAVSGSANVAVNPATGTGPIDVLTWMTLSSRSSQHMAGDPHAPYSVQVLDTDPIYPSGYPTGVYFQIKNKLGNPWDIRKYDQNYIYHWITENGDSVDTSACQAANGTTCWLYARAYKRFLNPLRGWPRYLTPGSPVTIDSPSPNTTNRTVDCEAHLTGVITLGDVRTVTSGPTKYTWGGSIDHGAGSGAQGPTLDSVNGVDTIVNLYYYSGTIANNDFKDREEYYIVFGWGEVAWYYYHRTSATAPWVWQNQTVNPTAVSGGAPAPNFPCGAGKPWW
jgi:hypothetical protein